ncbi:MAG: hypothetical protein FJY97_05480 [candidate division Zixibacteria bacterium]|nr:hypothetical protein [candidate division Zixibacteria bacterium]
MSSFPVRRWADPVLAIFFSLSLLLFYTSSRFSFSQSRFYEVSGWCLWGLLLVLALFTVRKKLPFLPLFTAAGWLRFHLYAGVASVFLFGLHVKTVTPTGAMEIALTLLFILVVLSGLVGWGLSRLIPKRLTTRGEQVIFERIPELRLRLGQEVEALVARAAAENGTATLPEFHARRLIGFFAASRNFWWHLVESNRPYYRLMTELSALDRYLNDDERHLLGEMTRLIRIKDDLDYQYAHQTVLKYWLFIHIPLTYSLLMTGFVHGILMAVYYEAFRGAGG